MAKQRSSKPRKSKAESMTGAKEAETEVRKGELGLGEPVAIESKDFHFHMRAMKSAIEKKDTAVALLRSCRKGAAQINKYLPDVIAEMIKEERKDDPVALRQKLEVYGIGLKETGSPVQLSVHDTLMGDVKDVAYKRGFTAGSNGQTLANPYPVNSDLAESYQTGWRNGMGGNIGMSPEQVQDALARKDAETMGGGQPPPATLAPGSEASIQ